MLFSACFPINPGSEPPTASHTIKLDPEFNDIYRDSKAIAYMSLTWIMPFFYTTPAKSDIDLANDFATPLDSFPEIQIQAACPNNTLGRTCAAAGENLDWELADPDQLYTLGLYRGIAEVTLRSGRELESAGDFENARRHFDAAAAILRPLEWVYPSDPSDVSFTRDLDRINRRIEERDQANATLDAVEANVSEVENATDLDAIEAVGTIIEDIPGPDCSLSENFMLPECYG